MSTQLRTRSLAHGAALHDRHAQLLGPPLTGRIKTAGAIAIFAGLAVLALWRLDFSPRRLVAGLGNLGAFAGLMLPPDPGSLSRALLFLHALAETIAIAFLGTVLAAIIAFPIGFIAARNTTVHRVVQFASRRVLDGIRGIDALIWALLWINVVGLGPFAGVLAIMTSDIGAFGKLFSEAIETADRRPVEGIAAAGGGPLHRIRFGIMPQVFPIMIGQALYYFESNTRSSTIIGIVGAGGIGLHLSEMIRTLEWQAVSFIILLILVAVAVIDGASSRLRAAIVGAPVTNLT